MPSQKDSQSQGQSQSHSHTHTTNDIPMPTAEDLERIDDSNADESMLEGINLDMGGDDAESFGDFDPMQALGQLLVTQEGETIPEVLCGIRQALETLTKVLHKMSKQLDSTQ